MNVKEGDLAIIVRSDTGRNFGRIVRVEQFVGGTGTYYLDGVLFNLADGNGRAWLVTSAAKNIWLGGDIGYVRRALYADEALRPVSGLPDADDVTTDLDLEVTA